MEHVHIIGEAGTNHGGNIETAKTLVKIARASQVNSVKFQIIYPEGLYLPETWLNGKLTPNEVFEMRKSMMLSDDEYRLLAEYCQKQDIPFSASIFDERGLDLLDELHAPYYKFASCDLNNIPLLKEAASRGRKMIVSTGMAEMGEIETSVKAILQENHTDFVLMHCVSSYPCPTEQANLAFLSELKSAFDVQVGFSDHTENSLSSCMAVALGATWIEKHFTYDRSAKGFDHAYAMEPNAMNAFVADIRSTEKSLEPSKKIQPGEKNVIPRARRGLYAARDLDSGSILSDQDILIVRPEAALKPSDVFSLTGKKLSKGLKQFEAFDWNCAE